MIHSIRKFLFVSLFTSITIASSITAVGNYLLDKRIIQPYLDGELIKIHSVLDKLNEIANIDNLTKTNLEKYLEAASYPDFMFQIWSADGKLLFHSRNENFKISLKNSPKGFSDLRINEYDWRIYSATSEKTKNIIAVAEIYNIRNTLTNLITKNNAYILLATFPFFALLIWIIVGLALGSVNKVTKEISDRASYYLEPVNTKELPIEIKPLVIELNNLFARLKHAFDRNKSFSADAAHELQTPLAALKTQTQVALRATSDDERTKALNKIIAGVDRSSHVVKQLLILSQVDQAQFLNDPKKIELHSLAGEILALLAPKALDKNIDIELCETSKKYYIYGNEIILGILIRNIIDNAIRYTPQGGRVSVEVTNKGKKIIFRVIDSGPGIPLRHRKKIFQRFYRIYGTKQTGSGLGNLK